MARPRWASALEVLGFYGSILLGIWIGQRVPIRLPVLATGVVFLALCSLSNHFHRDSREKIGLAATHFKPCAKLVLKTCTIPLIVLAFFAARQPLPFAPKIFFGLLIYPVWAFAQDYALLS